MPLVIHGFDSCFILRLERVMKKSMLIWQLVYVVQGVKYIVNVMILRQLMVASSLLHLLAEKWACIWTVTELIRFCFI